MSGEVHIQLLSHGDTSEVGSYFRAHVERCHVRGGTGLVDHMCWTTDGQVRRAGLRAGRFVEAGPRAGRFV